MAPTTVIKDENARPNPLLQDLAGLRLSAQCPHLQKLGQADSQQPQAANLQNMTAAHPLDVQQSVVEGIVGRRTVG